MYGIKILITSFLLLIQTVKLILQISNQTTRATTLQKHPLNAAKKSEYMLCEHNYVDLHAKSRPASSKRTITNGFPLLRSCCLGIPQCHVLLVRVVAEGTSVVEKAAVQKVFARIVVCSLHCLALLQLTSIGKLASREDHANKSDRRRNQMDQ